MPTEPFTTAGPAPRDADETQPPIPVWLAHRPVVAGMAVPWITARGLDGRYTFGGIHPQRRQQAIQEHRCQVCGRVLDWRSVLLLRLSDLPHQCTTEPALDPVCAAYTAAACPMIAGRMTHYRATAIALGHGVVAAVDTPARLGAPAEPWFAIWLRSYTTAVNDHNGLLVASYAGTRPLRIRPITWRLPLWWRKPGSSPAECPTPIATRRQALVPQCEARKPASACTGG